ncbi:UDP-N-acetylmuramoyl-L-alanine--D-glutamate ligase [Chelatococcus reniformis]|uniref:UDP-N-acetylmuramoylalanine--D-glutamate ligase n=1 Tax=Chelatococcus reniformis TaxID=1494448 RepID=A0A916UBC8_9HYPH|nr:UDP-N-acetylmuramoyl-L-alanine--D-glutamate ligase [Chelatococcus reniformis]GGC67218.1 UDP-N-acetylmuramoylalanine--D-glutamate ligase [Chelatococcus reniformis]
MIPVSTFAGRRVALFGLGGSGLATAEALAAGGADVTAFDDAAASCERARARGLALADLNEADWSTFTALVLAPGVPLTHPAPHWTVERAAAAGIPVIGDIELFCRERRARAPKSPFVAITGTNGKSTTTALIAHLLREAGCTVELGGNIGTAILSLEPPAPERVHVVECSSYQIDLAPSLDPSVGVLLNVTPDHLDRHGTMDHYAAVKARLVDGADQAVIAVEDDWTRAIAARLAGEGRAAITVRSDSSDAARYGADGAHLRHDGKVFADLAGVASLRGRHNAQNALAAAAAVAALGVAHDVIARGLATFPGLAHRMEPLGSFRHVAFVNDSKATNADSTDKALSAFQDGIFWILGGKQKEGGIASLNGFFAKIDKAYLIGDATEAFAATLEGRVPYVRCGTLDRAVAAAADDALASTAAEAVVLLSPACASFDQYPNFEARGEHFRKLVAAWLAQHGAGAR